MSNHNALVAIVGRPNVGKSSLFNRLIGQRKSIVEAEPGVTRDRIYAEGEWGGRRFSLVDTGGLVFGDELELINSVRKQVKLATEEADLLLFLVDAQEGITSLDEEIARVLRKINKPLILAANKADNSRLEKETTDFYRLGLAEALPVSATHGLNINQLLDKLLAALPDKKASPSLRRGTRVAVVGRPNVGKSSFLNTLLQEERLIVDSAAGTTRDAVDISFHRGADKFIFVDTAGMRPRNKVKKGVESYSSSRARRSIQHADITLLLIDAAEGSPVQDSKIASYISEQGKGCIILANKWDLVLEELGAGGKSRGKRTSAKISRIKEERQDQLRERLQFLNFSPFLFISALTGEGVEDVIELIKLVSHEQNLRPSRGMLNKALEEINLKHPPREGAAKPVTLHRLSQVGVAPPTFLLFANNPQWLSRAYLRYFEHGLRNIFGFIGTPLKILPRKGK